MYKCIFNSTTGQIYAICSNLQDFSMLSSNYKNVDWISIDEQPRTLKNFNWRVDLVTRQLLK